MMWPCTCFAETTSYSGKKYTIEFVYEGAGDLVGNGLRAFSQRIRNKSIWRGVELVFLTPLGQKCVRVYEGDAE